MNIPTALLGVLGQPKGAAHYVQRLINAKKLSANKAATMMGVNQSTLTRFLNGGALTPSMAAKLNKAFELDVEFLFNLEAQKLASKAKECALA